ncbi:unnamed protein product [Peronospora belbahrii]|uniref:Uncharacterized protein n=1 Tax=Peronospora belbahrii TaxID=622444 RepID=A0AAU9KM39_9STRA|nr:unnamed protein product [Peronospora belbahrii]CAH0515119.1 unnamed protein product [Peronospora belbahrii]
MGGQTSRMLREILQDSMYIIQETNYTTYQRSRMAHNEVQEKIIKLRQLKQEMLQSTENDAHRSNVFESFQNTVGRQKQTFDEQVEGFVQQFELPKSYQRIADVYRHQETGEVQEKTTETVKHPEKMTH